MVDERDTSITSGAIRLHRLVREVATMRRDRKAQRKLRSALVEAMAHVYPAGSYNDPKLWFRCAMLTPHLRAICEMQMVDAGVNADCALTGAAIIFLVELPMKERDRSLNACWLSAKRYTVRSIPRLRLVSTILGTCFMLREILWGRSLFSSVHWRSAKRYLLPSIPTPQRALMSWLACFMRKAICRRPSRFSSGH
jgi:hypothetical protein